MVCVSILSPLRPRLFSVCFCTCLFVFSLPLCLLLRLFLTSVSHTSLPNVVGDRWVDAPTNCPVRRLALAVWAGRLRTPLSGLRAPTLGAKAMRKRLDRLVG